MTRTAAIPADPCLLLKPQQAANALGVSLRTLMGLVATNDVPHVRLGDRNLRFPLEGLRSWVNSRTTWPTTLGPTEPPQAGDGGPTR
jgi:excisionase family DNA binding protein